MNIIRIHKPYVDAILFYIQNIQMKNTISSMVSILQNE